VRLRLLRLVVILCAVFVASAWPARALVVQESSEKDARTPAQKKINSQILGEIYRARGIASAKRVPPGPTIVTLHGGRALVDIRADVSDVLEEIIVKAGGTIVSTSPGYRSIVAWLPLLKLEGLAQSRAVQAIEPGPAAMTNTVR
jgi:hypothetical protein